ncbi:hypothetical protein KP005_20360 [Geomonas nitrogeniifigens]|uniref:DUF11 domain-containing protein n=1 Tax=Geomonas diazotrophica TaxID=2843197 RepID=A0ABX8JH56_9BACT|nr:hypothetical protein [Geomonas nitrogeniifigens]QWV97653.1 hypothetical protein KP005_20360 [Geomonas nitrogeniifigens]
MKRNLFAALALSAVAAVGVPATAMASTTAGTTILNVVTVDYKDATNTNSFSAAFSTSVSVNLVKAGLNITTAPSTANYTPAFSCAALGSYASGGTFSAVYAMTATANGQDTYKLNIEQASHNASTSSATYTILKADGNVQAAATSAASDLVLNSAIVVGTSGTDTLLFPGGSLKSAADGGFAAGDIVVVDYGATKTAYLVKNVTLGHAAGYTVNGAIASTATGKKTDEERDQVQVEAFVNVNGIGNGGTAPAFNTTAPAVGTVVGEMAIVKIDVTAVSSAKDLDASVDYKLTVTDSSANNTQYVGSATNSPANTCPAGNFLATKLEILKQVRNFTDNGSFGATATSDPGKVLEYLVTVTNNGGQANSAAVIDNIPTYTKLVTFQDTYGGTVSTDGTGYFAQIFDGVNTVNLTVDASGEVAAQPLSPAPSVGFGKAAAVTAGAALNFYLGQGSSASAGGTVPSCSDSTKNTQALCIAPFTWNRTYTIKYRVKVD